MIDDMIAVMKRINELQKRFGLKRHNPEINLQNKQDNIKNQSYRKTHDKAINEIKNNSKNMNLNNKINNLPDQYTANYKISQAQGANNNNNNNPQKNGIENLMNLLPGSIEEYSGGGSLYSPEILKKGISIFNNLLKNKQHDTNNRNKEESKLYFNNIEDNVDNKNNKEKIKKGIENYLMNVE